MLEKVAKSKKYPTHPPLNIRNKALFEFITSPKLLDNTGRRFTDFLKPRLEVRVKVSHSTKGEEFLTLAKYLYF